MYVKTHVYVNGYIHMCLLPIYVVASLYIYVYIYIYIYIGRQFMYVTYHTPNIYTHVELQIPFVLKKRASI